MMIRSAACMLALVGVFGVAGLSARAEDPKPPVASARLSPEARDRAAKMIADGAKYLRERQDKATGGWSAPQPDKEGKTPPTFPGITALVLLGMSEKDRLNPEDPAVAGAVKMLLNFQQDDGGIYDRMLPSYNTALAVSALTKVGTPRAKEAVDRGIAFLRKLQWSEDSDPTVGGSEAAKKVEKDHAFYGGVGYGRNGRPDNSNLNMFMQAMQDAGVSPEDPAVRRALMFLQRTQMDDRVNDLPFAKGSRQGGFVYATAPNAESVDGHVGQSMAGTIEETLSDGTKASRLRSYGSMTYAGFKSYLYAQLPKDDQRVRLAWDWIRRNYTLDENPGTKDEGRYYYYVVFARALKASGFETVETLGEDGKPTGQNRNWREDLVAKLAGLQNPDGSFKSVNDRWMENNPELITAYALIALRQAME